MSTGEGDGEQAERAAFILRLRQRGIRDLAVLRAIELVPRPLFVDPMMRRHAYDDVALPIACGQTMSQPSLVAAMTEALGVTADQTVLEVGTGSGYQAAVLSHLAARVVTVDRYRSLVSEAQTRFEVLGLRNVTAYVGDGMNGMPARAPFDRILVTAAATDIPAALMDQLKLGGVIVAPLGAPEEVQTLVRIVKEQSGRSRTDLMKVRFVPLVPGAAATL
ncbi:protein-L-isoaspartate(D-aspartate) O-methyltransferase [Xanthobacter flavus]|nr:MULTISPECIES: protein-L-isoaspartate(D-aspartate) O-methyltransferase [Xanthobacter]MBN8918458.1 protein-L-isoaspartate(D-aspartate) O-methyltransferase [Hyphomicrobiales bacterium]MDR6332247.1 protein-L-isoaspartate(D-aspartate) O-methyltransferase [Xanthobacter flavus]NMN56532.1 protein-L-isoaspartate(D-aspartate) O-methyltransferase [Xanthobacter sp. SG618]UDQ89049.1 protein-L-isoaspartate(D-aspartate) O-methyltransferase [Xanthobacter autotrophicus]